MASSLRKVQQIIEPQIVVEGAGVRLKRSIGSPDLNYLDPFLLFDHFGSENPDDYSAGFPTHPHRGIETVTYMLSGVVHHKDTLGNAGSIGAGDVQWMTAAGGIMHEEMPEVSSEGLEGFQLWVNLPSKLKMSQPRYQDIPSEQIPEIEQEKGVRIRVITGAVDGISGPVKGIAANPIYLDVLIPANLSWTHAINQGHSAFAYPFQGEAFFDESGQMISHSRMVVFSDGESVKITTAEKPVRFLLVSGKPLNEPIARYGPFVMNSQAEIKQALLDLEKGTFVYSN